MTSPFDYLKSILETKEDMSEVVANDDGYTKFIINKGLAQNIDTIMYAHILNTMSGLNNEMHYAFCYHSIVAKKRYNKWARAKEVSNKIEFISKHYNVSYTEAEEYSKILSDADIEQLKSLYDEVKK